MTPGQIIEGMQQKNRLLTAKNDEYLDLVEKRAQAERAYNIALARAVLTAKADGQSITLINTISKGDKVVAGLKYALDVSDGVMRACQQSIKAITLQVESYRSLLTWLRAEMTGQE